MEEKNELNDIILNKGGSNAGSKKLLLAIATLTLILIIVLVIMNSLKNDEVQKAPQAILPPEPTAPTEIINDPLFEPVEVIQEGNDTAAQGQGQDLNKVAQKIKEESLNTAPAAATTVAPIATVPAPAATKTVAPSVPAAPKAQPVAKAEKPSGSAVIKTVKSAPVKSEPIVKAEPKKAAQPVKQAPTKTEATEAKPAVKAASSAPAPTAASTGKTYYIQVGSFKNEPNKALFERLNASGMKYTTKKVGETTKILVGPFQGDKTAKDALMSVRQNVEANAFKIEE